MSSCGACTGICVKPTSDEIGEEVSGGQPRVGGTLIPLDPPLFSLFVPYPLSFSLSYTFCPKEEKAKENKRALKEMGRLLFLPYKLGSCHHIGRSSRA